MTHTPDELKSLGKTSNKHLENEEIASLLYDTLQNSFMLTLDSNETAYPINYGGAYINKEGNLVVLVIGKDVKNEHDFAAKAGVEKILTELAEFPFSYLVALMDLINAYKLQFSNHEISKNVVIHSIHDAKNRIVVEMLNDSHEAIEAFKKEVVNSPAIEFVKAEGIPTDDVSVTAGYPISNASVGYRVRKNGVNGVVTAAHAVNLNAYIKTTGGTNFAQCTTRVYSGGADAAYCKITNSSYSPSNTIDGSSSLLSTISANPGAGTTVYKRGKATNLTSGAIVSTNATWTINNVTFTNLSTASYNSDGGDSGGLIYRLSGGRRDTVGIHKGKLGGRGCYCKATLCNSSLGVSRY